MDAFVSKPGTLSVADYLDSISDTARQTDCKQLVSIIQKVTNQQPVMWGSSIIGFGSYHYKYASGHEGDSMKIGLSSRKEHIVLYGVIFYNHNTKLLSKLGKHGQGKGCLYIKKLADVDIKILEQMIQNTNKSAHPAETHS